MYKDKEAKKLYMKGWLERNREKNRIQCISYYKNNKEILLKKYKNKRIKNRLLVLSYYSNDTLKCKSCDDSHIEFLTIDHIYGGVTKHREEVGRGYVLYTWLIKNNFPEGYQVLCYNCNIVKSINSYTSSRPEIDYEREYNKKNRFILLSHYSNGSPQCICCGEARLEYLSIDHINGRTKEHDKEVGEGGTRLVDWIIRNNYPEGFRVLCHNCNSSLGHYGYCPHHPEGVPIPNIIRPVDNPCSEDMLS